MIDDVENIARTTLPINKQQILSLITKVPSEIFPKKLKNLYLLMNGNARKLQQYLDMLVGTHIDYLTIKKNMLVNFFTQVGQPLSREMVLSEIAIELFKENEVDVTIVQEVFKYLCEEKKLRYDSENDRVFPLRLLTHRQSIAHVLAGAGKSGLPTSTFVDLVNRFKVGKTELVYNENGQLEISLNNPHIFLSGCIQNTNCYTHMRFLEIPNKVDLQILMGKIISILKNCRKQQLQLEELYPKIDTKYSFYELRRLIKITGEDFGIYRNGTPNNNSISLKGNVSTVTMEERIIKMLKTHKNEPTVQEIAIKKRRKKAMLESKALELQEARAQERARSSELLKDANQGNRR